MFFDLLDKARELSVGGDARAQTLVERFERAETAGDIAALLKIEASILDTVRTELELFSDFEFLDIRRIQEDRHRCAHPTLDGKGNRFVPSPELARSHIVNAITILLQQPPLQGKAAIENVISVVSSKLFPSDIEQATVSLRQTGLSQPRPALLRNLIVIFFKKYLLPDDSARRFNFLVAFRVALKMHRKNVLSISAVELSRILRSVPDETLGRAVSFLSSEPELVTLIEQDQLERLKRFISSLSGSDVSYIEEAFSVDEFSDAAESRVSWLSYEEIDNTLFFTLPEAIGDRIIYFLRSANSFDEANKVCGLIRSYLRDLSSRQLREVLDIGVGNSQVKGAFDYKNLCNEIENQLK